MKQNINTKNIWEFDKEDTIYISQKSKSGDNSTTYLCQFERLVHNTVYGKVIEVGEKNYERVKVGDVIHNHSKNCALYGISDRTTPYFHWFNTMGYAYKDIGEKKTDKVVNYPRP